MAAQSCTNTFEPEKYIMRLKFISVLNLLFGGILVDHPIVDGDGSQCRLEQTWTEVLTRIYTLSMRIQAAWDSLAVGIVGKRLKYCCRKTKLGSFISTSAKTRIFQRC